MADELDELLETASGEVSKATVDGNSVENRSLTELIQYAKYRKGLDALEGTNPNGGPSSGWGSVCRGRAVLPGATGPRNSG